MLGFKSVKAALLISMLGFIGALTSTQASAACSFVSTKNGSPLPVKATATDTPQAKEFLETCINPYTKAYAADPTLITQKSPKGGKALFGYNGCSGCHGGKLEGVMAPSLRKDGVKVHLIKNGSTRNTKQTKACSKPFQVVQPVFLVA